MISGLAIGDHVDDGGVFFRRCPVDLVVIILTNAGHVGRDIDYFQAVDFGKFPGFGHRRAGHSGELRIQPEIILERDRCQGLVFILDFGFFLGF